MATPTHTLNLFGVLSESKRILNAHSRHFLALSVLFLLPLSFSLIIYPTLESTLSQPSTIPTQFLYTPLPTNPIPQSLTLPLIYAIFVFLLFLCAVATITYSTFHGFYGRPVKFVASVRSLLYSFLRLLATAVVAQVIIALVCIAFALFVGLVIRGFREISGSGIDFHSSYFIGFCVVLATVLALLLVWLYLNWALASVIVVVESKWGFEPLRRSTYLMRGMRLVSLSLLLFFGLCIWFWVWGSSTPLVNSDGIGDWRTWMFILRTVLGSSLVTLLILHYTAAHTVLYMYCKALHGELAFEIAEEFAREYVSLPFDDEKVPHVVSVVHA